MKKLASILILGNGLLSGCAGWGDMDHGLRTLHGQPLSAAVQRLGYPVAEERIGDMRLVVWSLSQTWTRNVPQTVTTHGSRNSKDGPESYSETTQYTVPVVSEDHCTIKLQIDAANIIRGGSHSGGLMTCQRYIHALNGRRWLFDGF